MNTILFVGEHAKTFDVQWHEHGHWELVYCTGGEGTFRFDNGTLLHYREGEVVAIPPHEVHSNMSQDGFTNIHMRIEDPSFPYRTSFRVADDLDRHLLQAFRHAQFYALADIKKRELVMSALGELIASYVVVLRSNAEFSEPVAQLRSIILRDFARVDFALDETIRSMPFHYDYLRKLFKKEMGMTPLEYMTKLRIKKAEGMLAAMSNDYSVSEIAALCGYDDALYFSRVFKKSVGCSPSSFAKNPNEREENEESEK